jgi:hypothetical protein
MGNKLASCTSGCLICGLESSPVHFHFPPRTASAPFTIRPLNNVDYQSCSPSEKDSLGLGHGSPQAGRAQSRRAAAVGIGRSPWPVAASVNRRPRRVHMPAVAATGGCGVRRSTGIRRPRRVNPAGAAAVASAGGGVAGCSLPAPVLCSLVARSFCSRVQAPAPRLLYSSQCPVQNCRPDSRVYSVQTPDGSTTWLMVSLC